MGYNKYWIYQGLNTSVALFQHLYASIDTILSFFIF